MVLGLVEGAELVFLRRSLGGDPLEIRRRNFYPHKDDTTRPKGITPYHMTVADCIIQDIVDGLEKAPEALAGVLEGRNFGKMLVRVSADPTR